MKKLLSLLVVGLLFGSIFATYSNISNEWLTPEYKDMNFHATLQDDGSVHMTWADFTVPSGHKWVYWKVMRSQTNDNPIYKIDQYIKYSSDLGFTRYTDNSPKAGINYYRVCAITQGVDGYHRYCSANVDKLVKEQENRVCTMEYAPVCGVDGKIYGNKCMAGNVAVDYNGQCKAEIVCPEYFPPAPGWCDDGKVVSGGTNSSGCILPPKCIRENEYNLSDSMKTQIDVLVQNFIEKLDDKFDNVDDKKDTLELIINKVDTINFSSSMKPMIDYLKEKLQEQLTMLTLEGLFDL